MSYIKNLSYGSFRLRTYWHFLSTSRQQHLLVARVDACNDMGFGVTTKRILQMEVDILIHHEKK